MVYHNIAFNDRLIIRHSQSIVMHTMFPIFKTDFKLYSHKLIVSNGFVHQSHVDLHGDRLLFQCSADLHDTKHF